MNKEKKKGYARVPVVYKGKALMPMTWYRARKFIKNKTGVLVKSKNLGWYLKLKVKPSGTETQEMVLGIDPGTKFNGYSVVSKYCHNANFQRNTTKVKQIQDNVKLKSLFRKERRLRLRHRPIRIESRTSSTITKTSHYLIGVRYQMISDIIKLYPISKIIIEDISFNHYFDPNKIGKSFSNLEIGKSRFRKLIELLDISLIEFSSRNTKSERFKYIKVDKKEIDKGVKSFYSHCFDSFCLANSYFRNYKLINKSTIFIEEITRSSLYKRRKLRDFYNRIGSESLIYWKPLKGYNSNNPIYGINWIDVHKYHKKRLIRFKPRLQNSNHGPWTYKYIYSNKTEYYKRKYKKFNGSFDKKGRNKDYNSLTGYYDNYLLKLII